MAESTHKTSIIISAQNRTQEAFGEVRRSLGDVEGAAGKLNRVLAGLGTGLSIAGLVAFAKSGIDVADALNKTAQSVGVSVENLQVYQRAAEFAGVENQQFNQSLARLAKGITDAAAGTGEAKDAFAALKISVQDAGGGLKNTDAILLEVADAFQRMNDGTHKTALAVDLFGQRIGPALVPLLNQGRAGVAAAREELDLFGKMISTATARQAEKFNDQLKNLIGISDKLKFTLAENLLPALTSMTAEMLAATKATGGLAQGLNAMLNLPFFGSTAEEQVRNLEKALKDLDASRNSFLGRAIPDPLLGVRESNLLAALALARQRLNAERAGSQTDPGPGPSTQPAGALGLSAAELKKQQSEQEKDGDAIRKALIEPYVQAAEEVVKAADEMVFTWNAAGERIEIPKEKFAEFEASLKKPTAAMQAWFDMIDREQDEAIAEGAILASDITDEAKRLEEQTRRNQDAARDLGFTFSSAFEDAVIGGEKVRDVLKAMVQDVARIFLRTQVTAPLRDALSGAFSGFDLGSFFGGGASASAPTALQLSGPFQHGGGFTVGGSGGTDRTFVGFRATAGEQVTVTPPGQHGGGGPTFFVDMRGATAEAVAELRRLVREVNGSIEPRAVAAVANARLRGGSFAGAFER